MPQGYANLHIDQMLTNYAAGYSNEEYIAKRVLETLPSPKETGKIAAYGVEHYRLDFIERAPGTNTPRIDWQPAAAVPFAAHEWSLEKPIDGRQAAMYDDPFDAERDATFNIMQRLMLKLEDLVGTLMTTSGNFGSTTSGTAWGTPGTGTPVKDIRAAMEAIRARTGRATFYGCCSSSVWNKLVQNNEVKNLYLNTIPGAAAPATIAPSAIAAAIGLRDIYVGPSIKLTSAEGAANAWTDVWGTTTFAVYAKAAGQPSPMNLGFGAIVIPNVEGFPGMEVGMDRYNDDRAQSVVIRGRTLFDQIAVNKQLGQLITGIS